MACSVRRDSPDIFNQSPPYEDVNLFTSDRPLQEAMRANGAESEQPALQLRPTLGQGRHVRAGAAGQ